MADHGPGTRLAALTEDDRAAWEPLWQGYLTFYKAVVPAEVSDVTFRRLTRGHEPMGGLLAWQGTRAVGLVHWILHRSCWTVGDYCYLQDLFVDPGVRGGGIGRRLIAAVHEHARAQGCARVHWLTHETNADAMKLYDQVAERSGFVQYRQIIE